MEPMGIHVLMKSKICYGISAMRWGVQRQESSSRALLKSKILQT